MAAERGTRRPRKARHGLVPLSSGEIALYAGRDEAARRRQRLLDVRDKERRIAQQVTQRYRENLDKLRGKKARRTQLELTVQHEVLLSELHRRYQLSLESMGTAHRNAREKLLELLEQANDEALKWKFNKRVVAKSRSGDAIRSHEEEERERLARRWEVEKNLMRLRDLATKQRTEASERARKAREAKIQRVKAAAETERVRRENMPEEVVMMPRPHANDVVSYRFTRLHCLSPGPEIASSNRTGVKIIRHNTRHPNARRGVDEAVKYREEVDKRLEQRRRENEENTETANARGASAMDVITSRKGGEKAMKWLASIDMSDRNRKELSPTLILDGGDHAVPTLHDLAEFAKEKEFARMFRINEEEPDELSAFSAGSEQELDEKVVDPARSSDAEENRDKLKARANFSADVQKPRTHHDAHFDQPISSDSEEESEGDGRLELLKDFLEATTMTKQRDKTRGTLTPNVDAQGSPGWQPTVKRSADQKRSLSMRRHGGRQQDEGAGVTSAKPATAATTDTLPDQRSSLPNAKTADSNEPATGRLAASLGQREEGVLDSDDGYTEQDSIDVLEDRLQEVLDLRLRRRATTAPSEEELDQERAMRPPQLSQSIPSVSSANADASDHDGGIWDGPAHVSEGPTQQYKADQRGMGERSHAAASAAADISSQFNDRDDDGGDGWSGKGGQGDRTSLRTDDGVASIRTQLSDIAVDSATQQRVEGPNAESTVGRSQGDIPNDAAVRQSFSESAPGSVSAGRHEAEDEERELLQSTTVNAGLPQGTETSFESDSQLSEREAGTPSGFHATEDSLKSQIKIPDATSINSRDDTASGKRSPRVGYSGTHAAEDESTGSSRKMDDAALSRSVLSDDVETTDDHPFAESEPKSTRNRARYSRSLSSSSEESEIDARDPRQPAAKNLYPHSTVNAYIDRVRLARRSSAGSPISQYSLPPSDLHSSFDEAIGDIQGDGNDSFVNELVPMFLNRETQRQQLSPHSSGGGGLAQYDLPSDKPASREVSPTSNASIGVDALSRRQPRVQGSLSPRSAGTRLSRRSSVRFELTEDTRGRPIDDRSKLNNRLQDVITGDDERLRGRNGRSRAEPLDAPTSPFIQYDLPDESDWSSVEGGSFASSITGHREIGSSDSGSSHSSIGFAVQLALASNTRRRRKGDESHTPLRLSQSRIAPMEQAAPAVGIKRGVDSTDCRDASESAVADAAAEASTRRYSSDSSTSVDRHLNHVVNATAAAGEALPLSLHVPPRVFGAVDMSKPPAPMHLTRSAVSSSSASSEPVDRGLQHEDKPRSQELRDSSLRSEHSGASEKEYRSSVRANVLAHSSRSPSPRSSWSGSEDSNEVYAHLRAMKLRVLPAAPLREVDMSQPPAPADRIFGSESSNVAERKITHEEERPLGVSQSSARQSQEEVDNQRSRRSSWSDSEKSDGAFKRLEAMKLHRLPEPRFSKGFDMSQPPAQMSENFEERAGSPLSPDGRSAVGSDKDRGPVAGVQFSPRSSESGDDVYSKLEALKLHSLPAPPAQKLDMSLPPAPMDSLYKQYSILSSSSGTSDFSVRKSHSGGETGASGHDRRLRDLEDEEEEKRSEGGSSAADSAFSGLASPQSETRAGRGGVSLHVPVGELRDAGRSVSLADAFQRRHPRFHLRAEQHRKELERRRQEERVRQQQSQVRQSGSKRTAQRASAASSSASASSDRALDEEQQELLVRLATGTRVKVSDKEMKERSRRLYQKLPEVVERRRQEEVLRRRRQRLDELREQEKARRLAQRERRQQQRQHA